MHEKVILLQGTALKAFIKAAESFEKGRVDSLVREMKKQVLR